MIKYIKATITGKGFITHEDQEKDGLKFSCYGDLVQITGDEKNIDSWISRVSGIVLKEEDYIESKAQKEKIYIEASLVSVENEKTELLSKKSEIDLFLINSKL